MTKKEAQSSIGQKVQAWTSANGVYVGILESVTEARPFRGKVKITGILEFPAVWDVKRRYPRKGFQLGEYVEVGAVNLSLTDKEGDDYITALENEIKRVEFFKDQDIPSKYSWWIPKTLETLYKIRDEYRVLQTKA